MSDPYVIGLRIKDGLVQPLAWSQEKPSKKEIRRATKKFMKDADVAEPYCAPWNRLYSTKEQMKSELPAF